MNYSSIKKIASEIKISNKANKNLFKKVLYSFVIFTLLPVSVPNLSSFDKAEASISPDVVKVTPTQNFSNPFESSIWTDWFFYNDETDVIDNTLGNFVNGPDTPPIGNGSAEMIVSGSQRRNLTTSQFGGIKLKDIFDLSYSTYQPSTNTGNNEYSIYLNFNVDFYGNNTYQGRLVHVPRIDNNVHQDVWETWDAIDSGDALWWWSGFAGSEPATEWPDGETNQYRTWDDLISSFENIQTLALYPWLGFRAGEPYSDGFTGYIDNFTIGYNDVLVKNDVLNVALANQNPHDSFYKTFDFDPDPSYSPYCGDGNLDTDLGEVCEIGDTGCNEQCQREQPNQCSDMVMARVNIDDVQNWGNGDMTNDIYLGSDSNMIPAGAWFPLYFNGNYINDDPISGYEDVPGLAVQRLDGQVRVVMHGEGEGDDKEHVDGNIEFYNASIADINSDDSGNNELENGFDNISKYKANQDEVSSDGGYPDTHSYFWLTTTTADDGYYTDWEIIDDCYEELICEPGAVELINPSFEQPEVTDSKKWEIHNSVPGWNITWESTATTYDGATRPENAFLELHENIFGPAADGDQYAELDTDWGVKNNEPASVRISQDVSTFSGATYQLTFAFSPRPNTVAGDNVLEVKADGNVLGTVGPVAGPLAWSDYTYSFTASSNLTTIEFADKGNPNSLGTFLDNVRLELIQCPLETGSICGVKFADVNQSTTQDQNENNLTGWAIDLYAKNECIAGDEWADEVVEYNPGPNVPADRQHSDRILGEAQNNDTMNFVSLGKGGDIVLKFDNLIENGTGADIKIYETSYGNPSCGSYPEYVKAYASQDGVNWVELESGVAKCQDEDPEFDLGSLQWAQYIKLVDATTNTPDGFDIDGVKALHCLKTNDKPNAYTTTTENGYCFNDLEQGLYMVCEELQPGWTNMTPLCQQVEINENNLNVNVDFGNYQEKPEPTGDSICGYKHEVDDQGKTLGHLANWPMSLWLATQKTTFEVDANNLDGFSSGMVFESGKTYKIEVTGMAWAGDGIYFDAKYSERNASGSWTDSVQSYESYGPELLDLQINGVSPDWGNYNDSHRYFIVREGDDSNWNFAIYDTYPQNNTGKLFVTVYELTDTEETTTTNENGYYCFEGLDSGHYVVQEGSDDNYLPYGSEYCQISDTSESEINSCDFYNYEKPVTTSTITVCKYESQVDESGAFNVEDKSVPYTAGWPMTIYQDESYVTDDVTGENGCVDFELEAGTYDVYEATYEGWTQSWPQNPEYYQVVLGAGEHETVDFFNRQYDDNGGSDCTSECGGGTTTSGGGGPTGGGGSFTIAGCIDITLTPLSSDGGPIVYNPGGKAKFQITITNNCGGTAFNAIVKNILPHGFHFSGNHGVGVSTAAVNSEGGVSIAAVSSDGATQDWDAGDLAPGASWSTVYDVDIDPSVTAGEYVNMASAQIDGNGDTAYDEDHVPIVLTTPEVQGYEYSEPEVKVLGYETLPETGGAMPIQQNNNSFSLSLLLGIMLSLLGFGLYLRTRKA